MSGHEQYEVIDAAEGRRDAAALCTTVIDALRGSTTTIHVDAYSDFDDQMPADIRAAEAWLRARGLAQASGDPGEAVPVAPDDEVGWAIAHAYAPWSTRVTLFDAGDVTIATLQHGGQFITVNLTADLRDAVAAALAPDFGLVPLTEAGGSSKVDDEPPAPERSASWFRRSSAR